MRVPCIECPCDVGAFRLIILSRETRLLESQLSEVLHD